LLAAYVCEQLKSPILYVCPHGDDADNVFDDLQVFAGRDTQVLSFPALEAGWQLTGATDEAAAERLRIALRLAMLKRRSIAAEGLIVVTSIQALMQPVPQPGLIEKQALVVRRGGVIGPQQVVGWLVANAFERIDRVDLPGQFAQRGGIIDIYAPVVSVESTGTGQEPGQLINSPPVRLEFFGDTIESIRVVDLDTQRSTTEVETVILLPVMGGSSVGQKEPLARLLPDTALVILQEPVEIQEVANIFLERSADAQDLYNWGEIYNALSSLAQLHICRFAAGQPEDFLKLGVRSVQQFEHKAGAVWAGGRAALDELLTAAKDNEVLLYCTTAAENQRLGEIITHSVGSMPKNLQLRLGYIHQGFALPSLKAILIGHHEIFGQSVVCRRIRPVAAGAPVDTVLDLQRGDYVVHVTRGIGKFLGVKTIRRKHSVNEYLAIEYADKAIIHVPVQSVQLVQKYIGTSSRRPALSKLGSKKWQRQKERVATAVRYLAAELLQVQARRESVGGIAYAADSNWQREFEEAFAYQETPDQISAAERIKADMQQAVPMDRLLCGDVGYGKTELAMRAAFKAVENGKQVAVLVPTTVLAVQHGRTFAERFADFPVSMEVLNRFKTPGQANDILRRAKQGRVDILIGTHRLLSKDVGFGDLGLVIVDEEQRFGVEHKEKLKRLRVNVDVLTMTATPIPRTLHMALLGIRDISSLATPPLDRRSIVTTVCPFGWQSIQEGIIRELNRQGQVFFLHNRVRSISRMADEIRNLVPQARVAVAHGQMAKHDLEKVMIEFVLGKVDVLVCSTIIEAGLDIPNANTIFINDADRFGLAELHQLRGRVGRYKYRAYAYLLVPAGRTITPAAVRRLKAIEEYSQLGAGFKIALRDLEIRGAGNILGPEQSGHIQAVGYEMYCRLLAEAVSRLKNQPVEPEPSAVIDLGFTGFIPKSYISSERQRLDVYRRVAAARTSQDLKQLEMDLADLFGKVPPEVQLLLNVAEVRLLASACDIKSVVSSGCDVVICFEGARAMRAVYEKAPGAAHITDPKTVRLRLETGYLEPPTLLAVLRKMFNPICSQGI
jgi:transcription-repair coupling factor (superfamily II helicase)